MREGEVIVGTVRAKLDNERYTVVKRDGSVIEIKFDGNSVPLIGGDVVGRLHFDDYGMATMHLKDNVLDVILEGSHKIYMMGKRPDLTARMLAKVLARSKSAVVSPGSGVSIERSTRSSDHILNWALNSFRGEAERRGAALNVIDVQSLARSSWEQSTLRDMALPADVEGNQRSLNDLTVLLRAGFKPYCSRMVESHSGNKEISLNFVLPYSPFLGATGYAREIANMGSTAFPITRMETWETQRFSAARTIALGLAHNCLGATEGMQADVESSPRAKHLAACFADAAAALTFICAGGRRSVISELADLKEASIHYGQSVVHTTPGVLKEGTLVDATHKAIRMAGSVDLAHDTPMREILISAAKIAKKVALPASRFGTEDGRDVATERELISARRVASNVSIPFENIDPKMFANVVEHYRYDIRELIVELGDNDNSGARLALYEGYNVPDVLKSVFEEEAAHLYELSAPTTEARKKSIVDRDKLASRIKGRNTTELEEDLLQFGESYPTP